MLFFLLCNLHYFCIIQENKYAYKIFLSVEEEYVKFKYLKHQNIHLVKMLTNTRKNEQIMKIIAEEKKTIRVRTNNIRTNYDQSSTW